MSLVDRDSRIYKKVTKLVDPFIKAPKVTSWLKAPYSGSLEALVNDPLWHWYQPNMLTWDVQGGQLKVESTQESVWWKNWRGPGLFTRVKGDIDVSTVVRTRKSGNETIPLDKGFQFGGLMLRNPKCNRCLTSESYVFNVVGQRGQYGKQVETKSTESGWSDVQGHDWSSGDAELRIRRQGSLFELYARELKAKDWKLMSQINRPDLPEILELGIIAYAFDYWSGFHDLVAIFDNIDINP